MSRRKAGHSRVIFDKVTGKQWQTPLHTRQASMSAGHLAALYSPQRVQRRVQQAKQLLQATLQAT
jgi:hypothetical protein